MVFAYGYNWNSNPPVPRHAPRPPDAGDYAILAAFCVFAVVALACVTLPLVTDWFADRRKRRQGSSPP